MSGGAKLMVKVAEVVQVNDLIKRFRFTSRDGSPLPAFSGGSHTVVEMDDHGTRRLNPYSLMGDPEDTASYSISVRRDDQGRGGSLFMHSHVRPGMEMVISHPLNLFPLDLRAHKHLMIAGGIGITPFLAQIKQLGHFGGGSNCTTPPATGRLAPIWTRSKPCTATASIPISMTKARSLI